MDPVENRDCGCYFGGLMLQLLMVLLMPLIVYFFSIDRMTKKGMWKLLRPFLLMRKSYEETGQHDKAEAMTIVCSFLIGPFIMLI
jgi:seryl-tRNA synthetase